MSKPERQLTPDKSAQHHFGYILRKWRKARGLSQERLGALVHVSGALLYRIETGDRRPTRPLAARCEEVLEAGGELLRAWNDYAVEVQRGPAERRDMDNLPVHMDTLGVPGGVPQAGSETITVPMKSLTGETISVTIDRRAFVGGVISLPLVGWLGRQMTAVVPGGDLDDIVREMASLRAVLTKQDNVLGPGVAAPTVIHQLSILEQLSKNIKGRARDSVRRIQASYAEFAGWLSDELGDRRAGQYWIDRALEWAHEADDQPIIGYVLARKAQRAADNGDSAAAISLAKAAQRCSGLTERVRAAALQYQALGHALAGDTSEFCASIDQAHELVESASEAKDGDWAVWCTPGYVIMHEASGWVKLREYPRAVTVYERGLADWPSEFRRDQGLYFGRLACAHAGAGNPEAATEAGRRALDIATGTGSARTLSELKPLQTALEPWRSIAPVRSFTDELDRALPDLAHNFPKEIGL